MVCVLSTEGDHKPEIPLSEVVGRLIVPPAQIGAIGLNVGVIAAAELLMVTKIVSVQLMEELTMQEYVPAHKLVALDVFCPMGVKEELYQA